jgi:hypothetical protein
LWPIASAFIRRFLDHPMRTTLDIADDVLFAAKDFARRDKKRSAR